MPFFPELRSVFSQLLNSICSFTSPSSPLFVFVPSLSFHIPPTPASGRAAPTVAAAEWVPGLVLLVVFVFAVGFVGLVSRFIGGALLFGF